MKFNAQNDVEPLDYDFRPYVEAFGTVPEPTQEAMGAFLDFYEDLSDQNQKATEQSLQARANAMQQSQETGKVVIDGDLPGPDVSDDPEPATDAAPEKRTWRELILGEDDRARAAADAFAGLCQKQPTGDEIWALPPRVRRLFTQMVFNVFILGNDDQGKADAGTNN